VRAQLSSARWWRIPGSSSGQTDTGVNLCRSILVSPSEHVLCFYDRTNGTFGRGRWEQLRTLLETLFTRTEGSTNSLFSLLA